MLTFFAFVFAIGLLVFIHEYGHYWAARRCGVGVLTFSIGFGKPLYQWQRGQTTWQIAAIPLGGFVKMLDESEAPVASDLRQYAFNTQHPAKKMAIAFAGPLTNLLFACLVYAGLYAHGVVTLKPIIGAVSAGSIAANAGLKAGDRITLVNAEKVSDWEQVQINLFSAAGHAQLLIGAKTAQGAEKQFALDLSLLKAAEFDQKILSRLGLSPFAATNRIAFIQAGSAAERAGLQVDDLILEINQQKLLDWHEFQDVVASSPSQALSLTVNRNQQVIALVVTPDAIELNGKKVGRIGVSPANDEALYKKMQQTVRLGPLDALVAGVIKTYDLSILTVKMFGKMLVGALSPKQVSGPLGIAEFAGQSAAMGWLAYLQALALISISLGVLNLMPVPILDGGHLLYHGYELLSGRTVPEWLALVLQKIGISLLLLLMALALFNDANRFLFGLG
ncbi:RIP metalloprotease RseP [Deefgea rivuli]|uniref:RIP metalloprotease RseP n=1 Tax=Deefgea rivuli TaxID=400948 RepID=UPI000484AB88|nr:RIP metalloprotease RseP [Deefgea rivuli]